MRSRQAVVLTLSGLTPAILGPYGTAILPTPHFNQIAANGFVLDRFVADSGESQSVLQSMWGGRHAQLTSSSVQNPDLLSQLLASKTTSLFISDNESLAELAIHAGFTESIAIRHATDQAAEDPEETSTARAFAAASQSIRDKSQPDLLWIHLDCLSRNWDVPLADRGSWAEEEGPQPLELVVPTSTFDPEIDPDQLLSWIYTYSDQVRLIDDLLGPLWLQLKDRQETLLLVAGTSGMALGEHGWIGPNVGPLLSPRTHLPLLLYSPSIAKVRCDQVHQPADIAETLGKFLLPERWTATDGTDLLKLATPQGWCQENSENMAISTFQDELAIQNAQWHWYRDASGNEKLFCKPADRFDLNDIHSRATEIAEQFRQLSSDSKRCRSMR